MRRTCCADGLSVVGWKMRAGCPLRLQTATGDTVVSSKSSALAAAHRAGRGEKKHGQNSEAESLLLAGVEIPEPVFFCTIEPPSVAKQPGTTRFVACGKRF